MEGSTMPKPFPHSPLFPSTGKHNGYTYCTVISVCLFLFLGVDTIFFCDREEKLLLYLDVGGKLIYLLIVIAMLTFALRKFKRNGGWITSTIMIIYVETQKGWM